MKVYLSGEIHTSWRDEIIQACSDRGINIDFLMPVVTHKASDDAGDVLGSEENPFWKDHKSASINAIRIKNGIASADLVIVKFGEKYRQWNAAFDAGMAAAMNKPYIVIHPEEYNHALKEVDAQASAVAKNTDQVVQILDYLVNQK